MTAPQQPPQQQSIGTAYGQEQYGGMSQRTGRRFEDTLTSEMRVALHDFVQAATVCNWCADECLGGTEVGMEECARLCRDVADLASLNAAFISRDSAFGFELAETFAHAAEECEQVCSRHPHEHCQECAATLRRAIDSTWKMLDSIHRQPPATGSHQQSRVQEY